MPKFKSQWIPEQVPDIFTICYPSGSMERTYADWRDQVDAQAAYLYWLRGFNLRCASMVVAQMARTPERGDLLGLFLQARQQVQRTNEELRDLHQWIEAEESIWSGVF